MSSPIIERSSLEPVDATPSTTTHVQQTLNPSPSWWNHIEDKFEHRFGNACDMDQSFSCQPIWHPASEAQSNWASPAFGQFHQSSIEVGDDEYSSISSSSFNHHTNGKSLCFQPNMQPHYPDFKQPHKIDACEYYAPTTQHYTPQHWAT